jgi:hypothetical protein
VPALTAAGGIAPSNLGLRFSEDNDVPVAFAASCVGTLALAQYAPGTVLPVPPHSQGGPATVYGVATDTSGGKLRIAVGAIDAGPSAAGLVRLFSWSPGAEPTWTDIASPVPVGQSQFGGSVALSGQELFVSEPGTSSIHCFSLEAGGATWSQTIHFTQYWPRAILRHGPFLFVGNSADSTYAGDVRVLQRGAAGWQVTNTLMAPAPAAQQGFGGGLAVVAGQLAVSEWVSPAASCTGRVWLYPLNDLSAAPTLLPAPSGTSGCSLFGTGLSGSGTTLIVRARDHSGPAVQSGAAFFYEYTDALGWEQRLILNPPFASSQLEWGISSNSNDFAVTAGDGSGWQSFFQLSERGPSGWSPLETVLLPDGFRSFAWGNHIVEDTLFAPVFSAVGTEVAVLALAGDCDGDGLGDGLEIAMSPERDCNGDGTPDDCSPITACESDINLDGETDGRDLSILVSAWGAAASDLGGDLNDDGLVDCLDLAMLLASWGTCE